MTAWLEIKKPALTYNTFRGYRVNVNNHIIPSIGNIKLSELQVDDVDILYLSLGEDDKGLSPATIRYVHRVLSGGLDYAVRKNLISSNVAKLADRPSVKRFQGYVYSIDELNKLLDLTNDTEMEVIIALAGFMGLRRGEVLGLHWGDVHFEEKYIQVKYQVIPVKGGIEITKPKSEKSIRKVPMTDNVLEILRRYRVKKIEAKLRQGSEYIEKDLVVSKMNGDLLSPSTVFNMFKRLLKDNNMPDTRFHDLRHAYCSMLINEVDDIELKTISEIMGHSNIAVTAEVYAHLMYKKKEKAIQGLNEAVSTSVNKSKKG
jgi:integrase